MGELCSRPREDRMTTTVMHNPCINHKTAVFQRHLTCESHTMCEECELECYKKKFCFVCFRNLSQGELESFEKRPIRPCASCKESKITVFKAKCGCLLCLTCVEKMKAYNSNICTVCNTTNWVDLSSVQQVRPQSIAIKLCEICLENFNRDVMRTLNCDHFFCVPCLKAHLETFLTDRRNEIHRGIPCFKCSGLVNDNMIEDLLTKEQFDKYNEIMLQNSTTECPNCKNIFISDVDKINCNQCNYYFCIICKKKAENCDCSDGIPLGVNPEDLSACPGCRSLYTKDDKCDHVKCQKSTCLLEFCFLCSALREPTMVHGNHYHRPICKHFSDYNGADDKYSQKCSKCVAKGSLCTRPKNLAVPRRVTRGEV